MHRKLTHNSNGNALNLAGDRSQTVGVFLCDSSAALRSARNEKEEAEEEELVKGRSKERK